MAYACCPYRSFRGTTKSRLRRRRRRRQRHRSLDLKVPNTPLKPIATVAYTLFSSHHFPHLLFFPLFLCSPSVESMGAEVKIWNPVEVAEQARHDYASQIHPSHLTIDPSLELPQMTPLVLFVILTFFSSFSFVK